MLLVRAAGQTFHLDPETCSFTEMVPDTSNSVGDGGTYPLGKAVTKLPAWVGMRSVAVALVRPRQSAVPIAVLAGAPRAMAVPKVGERRKVSCPPRNRSQ